MVEVENTEQNVEQNNNIEPQYSSHFARGGGKTNVFDNVNYSKNVNNTDDASYLQDVYKMMRATQTQKSPVLDLDTRDYYPDVSNVIKGYSNIGGGITMPLVAPSALIPYNVINAFQAEAEQRKLAEQEEYIKNTQFQYAQTKDNLRNELLRVKQYNDYRSDLNTFQKEFGASTGAKMYANSDLRKTKQIYYHNLAKSYDKTYDIVNEVAKNYMTGNKKDYQSKSQFLLATKYLQMMNKDNKTLEDLQELSKIQNDLQGTYSLDKSTTELASVLNNQKLSEAQKLVGVNTNLEQAYSIVTKSGIFDLYDKNGKLNPIWNEYIDNKMAFDYASGEPMPPKKDYVDALKTKLIKEQTQTFDKLRQDLDIALKYKEFEFKKQRLAKTDEIPLIKPVAKTMSFDGRLEEVNYYDIANMKGNDIETADTQMAVRSPNGKLTIIKPGERYKKLGIYNRKNNKAFATIETYKKDKDGNIVATGDVFRASLNQVAGQLNKIQGNLDGLSGKISEVDGSTYQIPYGTKTNVEKEYENIEQQDVNLDNKEQTNKTSQIDENL